MGKNIEEKHLIDRYLQEGLTGLEKEQFISRINSDEKFRQEVELQRIIIAGIQFANHERLKQIILSSTQYRKPAVPVALKMIITFLVVTVAGISLWFYVGNESTDREQTKSWFAFLRSKKTDDVIAQETPRHKTDLKFKTIISADTAASGTQVDTESEDSLASDDSKGSIETDSLAPQNKVEDIIVKQDQLMIETSIPVEDKSGESTEANEGQLTADAVSKLNPASDLPETEALPSDYFVEFWVSPINYRGYKMSKNKLVL